MDERDTSALHWSRWRTRRRAIPAIALTLIALVVPALVFAASFGDVPPSSPYYASIEKVAAAGITSGCGNGNYCPKATVTREQMATFLGRTGGMGEQGTGGAALSTEAPTLLATVDIKPGNASGGVAYVQVLGTFGAFTEDDDAGNYPYKAVFFLAQDATLLGFEHYVQITALASDGYGDASGAVQVLIEIPTGAAGTYDLYGAQLAGPDGGVFAYGTVSATYLPYSTGGGWQAPGPELVGLDVKELVSELDRGRP
jgi:hypothetical protein